MAYGTENDEVTSGSSAVNQNTLAPTTVTDTVVLNGLVSGTTTIVHDVLWTETGSGTQYNRTFTIAGTRSVTFNNYSNVAGRSIQSGTITVTVSNGTITTVATTVAPTDLVTVTATNVDKTIKGTVVLSSGTKTYTVDINLTVTVNSRVTDWTLGASLGLTDPVLVSRNTSVTGTVTINGKTTYNINNTLGMTPQ